MPAIAAAVFSAAAPSALGQPAPLRFTPVPNGITTQRLGEWIDLARTHRPGQADQAARRAVFGSSTSSGSAT
jgi:hypothetical protein